MCAALAAACGFQDPTIDDVGDAPYCDDVAEWEGDWAELEEELLREVDAVLGEGGDCGETSYAPRVTLDLSPALRCAARRQARDIARLRELTHQGADGTDFQERAHRASYEGIPRAELLAVAYPDPADVLAAWLAMEEVDCPAIFEPGNDEAGAGVFQAGDTLWWVLTLGSRR